MPPDQPVKAVVWTIQYSAPPTILRYCKKCGRKSEYACSKEFRVNAQQKILDIWLIYKCVCCKTTWNSTIYSRVSPQHIGADLLERFHSNDEILAMQYAMEASLLQKNGVEIKMPAYQVMGEEISLQKPSKIKIQSQYSLPLKISAILRAKLGVSQREFNALLSTKQIQSSTGQDLKKCKLSSEVIISISDQEESGGD